MKSNRSRCSLQKLGHDQHSNKTDGFIGGQQEKATNQAKAATSNRRREKRSRGKKKYQSSQETDDIEIIDFTEESQMPITQQTNDSDDIVNLTQENAKSHAAMNDYNSKNEIVNGRRSKSTRSRCTVSQ